MLAGVRDEHNDQLKDQKRDFSFWALGGSASVNKAGMSFIVWIYLCIKARNSQQPRLLRDVCLLRNTFYNNELGENGRVVRWWKHDF